MQRKAVCEKREPERTVRRVWYVFSKVRRPGSEWRKRLGFSVWFVS